MSEVPAKLLQQERGYKSTEGRCKSLPRHQSLGAYKKSKYDDLHDNPRGKGVRSDLYTNADVVVLTNFCYSP